MGLGATLSNALSGMRTSQSSLEVLSRNVANAGTPGYHKQSLSVIDNAGVNSASVRSGTVERAFNRSLQAYYTNAVSDASFARTAAATLDRLQAYLGKPGDAGSLDTMFGALQNSLQALGTSPENYATRAAVVSDAQAMAATLNALTREVQGLRQETETQMAASVETLNTAVRSLQQINERLADQSADAGSRAALMDQRDRLVAQISEEIDVRVDYRSDDTVSLMTRSGVGILDVKASTFAFAPAGALTASSGGGQLTLVSPSGTVLDLVQQNIVQSGRLGALIQLRDDTLVAAQSQLDDIAAGLAQAFSTVTTEGTPDPSGTGFSLDLAGVRDGNDVVLTYTSGGVEKTLRVVRVDDPGKLPLDYVDANGARVVGARFTSGAEVATAVAGVLGAGFSVSATGSVLTVLDDGAGGTTDVGALGKRTTSTLAQDGSLGFNLFVDRGNTDFTNSLGGAGQKLGFAGRIGVNSAVLADNTLLVKSQANGSLGDTSRANYLLEQVQTMRFASTETRTGNAGSFRLGGTLSDLVAQTMNHAGALAAAATGADETSQLTMDTLEQRLSSEYGVNVDEEMARLMELQNAYAANGRVISVVQDLLQRLMDI
jgi:flagellar hook-associated protein 1 FlgK